MSKTWAWSRDAEGEPSVWMHWSNGNEDANGDPKGLPWTGRAWFHGPDNATASAEWALGPFSKSAGFSIVVDPGGDDVLSLSLKVPLLASLYLSFSAKWLRKIAPALVGVSDVWGEKYKRSLCSKEFSIRFFDRAVWWNVWTDPGGWTNTRPKWRDGNFKPIDAVLGKEKYTSLKIKAVPVVVPMPERSYAGVCELTEDTWQRPRWPWPTRVLRRAFVEMHEPVPVPGKGENSYDCGEDAIYSIGTSARTASEAVGEIVKSALRTREKHGGLNWKPEEAL